MGAIAMKTILLLAALSLGACAATAPNTTIPLGPKSFKPNIIAQYCIEHPELEECQEK